MLTLSRWKVGLVLASLLFGILFTLPNVLPQKTLDAWPAFLPHQKLNLGLDLQGGSYLLYEVDTQALRKERLTNLTEDIRTKLRNDQIDFSELGVVNGKISVRINDPAQVGAALKLLEANLGERMSNGARDVTVQKADDQHIQVGFVSAAFNEDAKSAVR